MLPTLSSDCSRSSGSEVVLLNVQAGVTHGGSLKIREMVWPSPMDMTV